MPVCPESKGEGVGPGLWTCSCHKGRYGSINSYEILKNFDTYLIIHRLRHVTGGLCPGLCIFWVAKPIFFGLYLTFITLIRNCVKVARDMSRRAIVGRVGVEG